MAATWIVSANASRARIFAQNHPTGEIEEIKDMVNEEVRMTDAELETDSMGPTAGTKSTHNTGGQVPNKTYQPRVTPQKRAAEIFARDINRFLLEGAQQHRYDELDLVVSPKFLGALRQLLDDEVKSHVKIEIDKDFTSLDAKALQREVHEASKPH